MKEAFDDWWDAPIDMTGNPFRQDCAAYWAWAGWVAGWKAAASAERKAIEPIVYGLCISDNNAQEIVNAIRKRGQG